MNSIKVTIPFSFKGKEYNPSVVIDLDAFIQGEQTLDTIYQLVANENNIDNYSYEYEVLEASPKYFSEPHGIAAKFLKGHDFDLEGYKKEATQNLNLKILQTIAKETMGIDRLEEHDSLKHALQQAYAAGENSAKNC